MPGPVPPLACPDCGAPMLLRESGKFTYPNGRPHKFWGCSKYPDCRATHGAHPNGQPFGIPADSPTKAARNRAHEHFDPLWQRERGGTMSRVEAYRFMQRLMGMTEEQAHIGRFSIAQCDLLIQRLASMTPPAWLRGGGR